MSVSLVKDAANMSQEYNKPLEVAFYFTALLIELR
jgi:hypothetical protein